MASLIFLSPHSVSPFLACDDFHARSRFARSTIPEEKWGTTRTLLSNILFITHFSLQKKNATNNTFVFFSLHLVPVQLVTYFVFGSKFDNDKHTSKISVDIKRETQRYSI